MLKKVSKGKKIPIMRAITCTLSLLPLTLFILVMKSPAYEKPPQKDWSNRAAIDSAFVSGTWQDKMSAAAGILQIPNLDTTWAVNTLIHAMQIETQTPSSIERDLSSYGTNSEKVQRSFMRTLVQLGPSTKPALLSVLGNSSEEIKAWIAVVLGHFRDESVHGSLRHILVSHASLNVRTMTAFVLRNYKDTLDVPYLETALSDTNRVQVVHDFDFGHGASDVVYPVRMKAISTLATLGYKVVFDSTRGKYITEKRE
jgi:hypothetical protein